MAEPAAGKMVILHLTHQFWLKNLPLCRSFCAPTAGAAGRVAGESFTPGEAFHHGLQFTALFGVKAGGEAHVIKFPVLVVKAE